MQPSRHGITLRYIPTNSFGEQQQRALRRDGRVSAFQRISRQFPPMRLQKASASPATIGGGRRYAGMFFAHTQRDLPHAPLKRRPARRSAASAPALPAARNTCAQLATPPRAPGERGRGMLPGRWRKLRITASNAAALARRISARRLNFFHPQIKSFRHAPARFPQQKWAAPIHALPDHRSSYVPLWHCAASSAPPLQHIGRQMAAPSVNLPVSSF